MGEHSVVLQEGRRHQRQRQLLMPPFHGDRMRKLMVKQFAKLPRK